MHINTCDCAFMQGSEEWQNQAVIGCHISYRHMATGALLFMRSMLRLDQARYRRTCPHPPHSLTPRGTVTPSFRPNISLKIIFPSHIFFFCWDWAVRVVNMKSESVHLKGWQPVRDSERETPRNQEITRGAWTCAASPSAISLCLLLILFLWLHDRPGEDDSSMSRGAQLHIFGWFHWKSKHSVEIKMYPF